MTGITLMILGLGAFVLGLVVYIKSTTKSDNGPLDRELEKAIDMAIADGILTQNERNLIKQIAEEKDLDYDETISAVESKMAELKTESETELIDINTKNGIDFEKYVVQKFDKRYFSVKEWAGDKYVNGTYAETTLQPDLLMEFKLKNETHRFSVECKWRKGIYKNGVEFATVDQIERYKAYQKSAEIPVFIAIGLGGKGNDPKQLFIVPLDQIKSNFISLVTLRSFEKKMDKNFYFDSKTNVLK